MARWLGLLLCRLGIHGPFTVARFYANGPDPVGTLKQCRRCLRMFDAD